MNILCSSYAKEAQQKAVPAEVQAQLSAYINKYIDAYEAKNCGEAPPGNTCRGTEYKKARRFCFGDIDSDGRDDIAVLYTIESFCCGNNYYFYLAVFLDKGNKFEFIASAQVGGKGERGVEFGTIRESKILLNTKEYFPDDAMCCPSGKGKTTYRLENGRLVESERVGEKLIPPIERFRRKSEQLQPFIDELLKKNQRETEESGTGKGQGK
jgi:hypothetical protein